MGKFIKPVIIFLLPFLVVFSACTAVPDNTYREPPAYVTQDKNPPESSPKAPKQTGSPPFVSITSEYYEDISAERSRSVSIRYPQVSGLKNVGFQEELNEKLRPPYYEGDEDDELTLAVWSECTFICENILSFKFNKNIDRVEAYHWYSDMWAITVNTETGEYLDLSDIVRIDEDFKELFLDGAFVSDRFSHDEILRFEEYEILYDSIYDFYLTEESLGVIVGVSHAAGDYLAFEVPYLDIGDLLHEDFKYLADICQQNRF